MNQTDIIERAAEATFGPLNPVDEVQAAAWVDADTAKLERMNRLVALQDEHTREVAPQMDRDSALAVSCLLLDLALALHKGFKFLPGQLQKSAGLADMRDSVLFGLIDRHVKGDWGDVSDADREANEVALQGGGRILSCYKGVRDGALFWVKVWLITDADPNQNDGAINRLRLLTTAMLPSEY